jgi:thiol-disulfide isomerase/thioredoxin
MVHNPGVDLMYSLDDEAPRSIELVRPRDAPRLSLAADAVICLLSLRGCPSCAAFAPVWDEMCRKSQSDRVLKVHVTCATAEAKKEAKSLMSARRQKFPCVCVFRDGRGGAINHDDDYDTLDADALVSLVVAKTRTLIGDGDDVDDDDDDTPLMGLDMEEEEDEDEPPASSRPNADGVHVTHDASPPEVFAMCKGADARNRVCVLYYTTWCGHCNALKPVWNETVARGGAHSRWCAVNCETDEGQALADAEGVRGYPTIHLHHDFREPFKGERSVERLLDFVSREAVRPALLRRR